MKYINFLFFNFSLGNKNISFPSIKKNISCIAKLEILSKIYFLKYFVDIKYLNIYKIEKIKFLQMDLANYLNKL